MGFVLLGCGVERIDFEPVPYVPPSAPDAGPRMRYPSPAPCVGTVSGCAGLERAACDAAPHCAYANECMARRAFRCSSLTDEGECRQVPGCRFDDAIGRCDGEPEGGFCERLAGPSCDVAEACERTAAPGCTAARGCAALDATACESVPGCAIRCPTGDVACGSLCVDLDTNTDHCGACGAPCPGRCEGGSCFAYAPCTSDDECARFDDGNACTGVVQCVGGACQRTPAVVCNDDVECTLDRCDPATGACRYDPRDGYCAIDETCSTTGGCVEAPLCDGVCPVGEFCAQGTQPFCRPQGGGAVGAVCDTALDCVANLECVDVSTGGDFFGVCARGCSSDSDCPSEELCLGGVCSMHCLPSISDGVCGPELRCTGIVGGVTTCRDGRNGKNEGDRCTSQADCADGHLCVEEDGVSACRLVCDRDGARSCPSSRFCAAVGFEVYGREYGACLPG